jgi:D-hydroxyproline dehydrogenase subunit gamma
MFRKLQESAATRPLTILIDGVRVQASEGETVAGVLLRHSPLLTRTTPVKGSARGPFCMMGVCFECLAVVDGVQSTQTCLTVVADGMRVERQTGRREVFWADELSQSDSSGDDFSEVELSNRGRGDTE